MLWRKINENIFIGHFWVVYFWLSRHRQTLFLVWENQPGNEGNYAYGEIKECDGKICGEMLKAFNSSDKEIESKNIGRNIILGMSPKKNGNTVEEDLKF